MKKLIVFILFFAIASCEKEIKKKIITPIKTAVPVVVIHGKSVPIDSLLLKQYDSKLLDEFYFASGYKSVWQYKKDRKSIIEQLSNSDQEGLKPANYSIERLSKFEKKYNDLSSVDKADYDILLTRSLQKYISHIKSGKLNFKSFYTDWDLVENKINVNETIAAFLKSDSLDFKLKKLKPNHQVYKSLKKALNIINTFPKDSFSKIEIDKKIVLHDTNVALIKIKKRLIYWKDLKSVDSLTTIYDERTFTAMKKFQIRHGLAADGVIGNGTVAALNFTKYQRRQQILVNLERWKWFPNPIEDEYLLVNIPDYKLTLVKGNEIVRTLKVIVGKEKRPTPVLSSKISSIVFNPTWTVPPTILKEDVIPSIAKNRNYLARKNLKVYNQNGHQVSANSWSISKAKGYRYIQNPGPSNSLGLVKFMFPNRFSVYLHDTNHRDYFDKHLRALSSGCVRVSNPLELAEYLLDDNTNWNAEKIAEIIKSKKTTSLKTSKKIPVHVLYWTAWSENNTLIFRKDIYNLDSILYSKL